MTESGEFRETDRLSQLHQWIAKLAGSASPSGLPEKNHRGATAADRGLDDLLIGCIELDASECVLGANRRACEVLAVNRREILGKPLSLFLDESARETARSRFQQALRQRENNCHQYRIRCGNSPPRVISLTLRRFAADSEEPRVWCLVDDVTGRPTLDPKLSESEWPLRGLLEHMTDVALLVTRDGRIEHANRSPWRSLSELIGTSFKDCFQTEYHGDIRAHFERVLQRKTPQLCEAQDHLGRWWLSRSVTMSDGGNADDAGNGSSGGDHSRIMVICTDVTGLKQRDDSLRRSESELRCLFDNTPDLVIVVDQESTVQFANRPLAGGSIRQLLGTRGFQFVDPKYRTLCRHSLSLTLATGLVRELEIRDVSGRWYDSRIIPMPQEDRPAAEVMLICSDVTSRKLTELSLRRSESRYRALFEHVGHAAVIVDNGVVLDCNDAAAWLFGCPSRNAMIGRKWAFAPPHQLDGSDSRVAAAAIEAAANQHGSVRREWLACRDDGTEFIADLLVTSITLEDRSVLLCVGHDITQRKKDEQAVRESEQRYRLLTENLLDWIWTADVDGLHEILHSGKLELVHEKWRWTFCSSSVERLLGYSVAEVMQMSAGELLQPDSVFAMRDSVASALAMGLTDDQLSQLTFKAEVKYTKKSGETIWCDVTTRLTRDERGRFGGYEGVTRDISERKNVERSLADLVDRRQQEISQQLHDELGQELLGIRLLAEGLKRSLAASDSPETRAARELAAISVKAQSRLREIIKGISPVQVAPTGLMAALDDLASLTERLTSITCVFRCDRPVQVSNSHTATELFYIAQEAVRNAVTHGRPTTIHIGLTEENSHLLLRVADDGDGIGRKAESQTGMGLRIMKHRAAIINASLSIKTGEPKGTWVTCKLPITRENGAS